MLDPGADAPSFSLSNQHGETVSLESIDADYTVVYFYPRADTPGCTTEACGFRDAWGQYAEADVAVVGISDDPVEDIEAFAEKYDLPFHLLSDADGSVASAYDSYGEKNVFGNVVDGVFRNTYVVDAAGEIVLAYEGVDPEDHAETILADVENERT
ncbi:peroxiredoxin Q/BCP [Halopenitus malekzadehii]|uniref:thioredoxin-dependent peroxiredoxin n=1 Tax=Halopenitus malekzadehii TaxID=1267564 RepID=A0A1H6IF07_9EURY|nr:thioredoxin-dependent thiol peroxidase [Halopenitus malekzadehii]SEH47914.1 peroxiredoxin Q/BCP [Halopenitus malekzadehii]